MAKYEVEVNGQRFEVDVPDGVDPTTAIDEIGRAQGGQSLGSSVGFDSLPDLDAPATDTRSHGGILNSLGDAVSTAGDFAQGTLEDAGLARGVGLTARTAVGAIPKTATSIADLGSMLLNIPVAGVDKLAQAFGDQPLDARLDTNNTQQLNQLLSEFFPEPTGIAERAVDMGGEALLSGGLGGLAMVSRASQLAPKMITPSQVSAVTGKPASTASAVTGDRAVSAGSFTDDIVNTFATKPLASSAAEFGGGAGASAGSDIANELDVGPLGQIAATVLGGLGGSTATSSAVSRGPQVTGLIKRAVEPITGNVNAPTVSERITGGAGRRAATELQRRAADPAEAARRALNAEEGVTPSRATRDPELMALEARVLDDNRHLANKVNTDLDVAEARVASELTADLPPGIGREQRQQQMVQRAAPEGVVIEAGDPDIMLRQARDGFREAYDVAKGFPIRRKDFDTSTTVPILIRQAVNDAGVLTDKNTRKLVSKWATERYNTLENRPGVGRGGTQADDPQFLTSSDDLLELRSVVRDEARRQSRAGVTSPDAAARAELLDGIDKQLTTVLESQLPTDVSEALRATDLRYRDYKTVEGAILRSGEKGLTPEALRASIRSRTAPGAVARGETGDLGRLAEQSKTITKLFRGTDNNDDQIRRVFRTMDDTTAKATRADITRDIAKQAGGKDIETGIVRLSGKGLTTLLEQRGSALRAAGFTNEDIGRMQNIAKRLTTIQAKSPRAADQLVDDHLGFLSRLASGLVGARATKRLTEAAGTGGTGSLMLGGTVRRGVQDKLASLNVDGAQQLLTDAMTDKELYAALLTRSTASQLKQMRSNHRINAWFLQNRPTDDTEEE